LSFLIVSVFKIVYHETYLISRLFVKKQNKKKNSELIYHVLQHFLRLLIREIWSGCFYSPVIGGGSMFSGTKNFLSGKTINSIPGGTFLCLGMAFFDGFQTSIIGKVKKRFG